MTDKTTAHHKEGFLQKAGKHSFQAWRKRWFVLNNDDVKYYNPGPEYDENNLLGVISVGEIRSLVSTKTPKHAFDIVTRTRTYNVAAKSDLERDDWIIALRKASDDKRNVDVQPLDSTSNYPDFSDKSDKKTKKEKTKKSKKGNFKLRSDSTTEHAYDSDHKNEKYRSKTLAASSPTEIIESPKRRSMSMGDSLTRANSMLRHMSIDDNSTEAMYQELNDQLEDDAMSSGDETEHHVTLSTVECDFPAPREGTKYAFDNIKTKLNSSLDSEKLLKIDLVEFAKANNLTFNSNEEFIATSLLRNYLQVNS